MKRFWVLCVAALVLLQSAFAQEPRRFEYAAGPILGVGFGMDNAFSVGVGGLGGYKFNKYFSSGLGIDFMSCFGRPGLYYTYTGIPVGAAHYHAIRPYIYCRYDILPDEEWSPYVGARLGYVLVPDAGFQHKVGMYGALDLGVMHRTDDRGRKLSFGISIESQYLQYLLRRSVSRR